MISENNITYFTSIWVEFNCIRDISNSSALLWLQMGAMASEITSLTIVYSAVYSIAGQRKHQSSASLAFVPGIHRWPVNSPHIGPVTRKMLPFDDVIMKLSHWHPTRTHCSRSPLCTEPCCLSYLSIFTEGIWVPLPDVLDTIFHTQCWKFAVSAITHNLATHFAHEFRHR